MKNSQKWCLNIILIGYFGFCLTIVVLYYYLNNIKLINIFINTTTAKYLLLISESNNYIFASYKTYWIVYKEIPKHCV